MEHMPDEFYSTVYDMLEEALDTIGGEDAQHGIFGKVASLIMDIQDVARIALGEK